MTILPWLLWSVADSGFISVISVNVDDEDIKKTSLESFIFAGAFVKCYKTQH